MPPHVLLGSAVVPGHSGELRCISHDGGFSIWIDHTELMSSRANRSEQSLAQLALERLGRHPAPRVLVGGLGMGFTLARTLALVDENAIVEVAELVPEVVTWNRELLGHCAGHPLRDPRTRVVVGDVGAILQAASGCYDVVLLDVDNGPEGLSRPANDSLYGDAGLAEARAALRPGGVLAVWSSLDNPEFDARLRVSGFAVTRHRVRSRSKGPWRTIWVALRN